MMKQLICTVYNMYIYINQYATGINTNIESHRQHNQNVKSHRQGNFLV